MKNLKKISREALKSFRGNGIGSGIGGGGCQEHLPMDPPPPGEPVDCGCNQLMFCPRFGSCIHMSAYTPEFCAPDF